MAVLADGNVIPGMTVTDGAITLPNAAAKVHVGMPYSRRPWKACPWAV